MNITIRKAETAGDFEQGRILFREYANSLPFDLAYQHFEEELHSIAQQYNWPEGVLLLCSTGAATITGCVGVRRFSEGIAELKRLYVKPDYRSLKLGKGLLEAAIDSARQLGYRFVRLDTVPGQHKAQDLYQLLGFYEIAPYRHSPVEGTMYLEKTLTV